MVYPVPKTPTEDAEHDALHPFVIVLIDVINGNESIFFPQKVMYAFCHYGFIFFQLFYKKTIEFLLHQTF